MADKMDWSEYVAENLDCVNELEFVATFSTLTDEERIEKCLKNERLMSKGKYWINTVQKRSSKHLKSQKDSLRFREDGNQSFSRRSYEEAASHYSKAILYAPSENDTKDCLSIGYANRSAANFHLKLFDDCLEDIKSSIDAKYPHRLLYKLQQRKAECLVRLGRCEEAAKEAEIGLKLIESDETLVSERKAVIRKELLDLKKKDESTVDSVVPSSSRTDEVRVSYGENEVLRSMSAALTVKEGKSHGRYIVARAEIKAGDVLFVEKPFASVLLQEFNRTHCEHCHAKVKNLFPCKKCTQVSYCSKECQSESWRIYHHIECGYLDLLQATGFGHLVFRIILVAGLPYLLSKRNGNRFNVQSTSSTSEPYLAVYSLVTNAEQMKPADVLAYATTVTMLSTLLENQFEIYGDRVFICTLMLRHCQQIICNAHAITGMSYLNTNGSAGVEDQIQTRIATAVYPTVSLMNHSCEPVIASSFDGKVVIVRAVKDIPIAGQIYTCYGPHYKRMPTAERRSALKQQYFFDCDCNHCTTNEIYMYKCFECSDWIRNDGHCNSCGHLQDCSKATEGYNNSLALFLTAQQRFQCGKLEDALQLAKKCLSVRKQFLYRFHRSLGETYDFIARVYSTKGLFKDSSEYLSESLAITEQIYGFESIELANEIQKYTDVAFKAMVEGQIGSDNEFLKRFFERVVMELQRGVHIFKLNYGSSHESTKDMIEKLENLSHR